MITTIVEVTNLFNWGKFLVAKFDSAEWEYRSRIERPKDMGGGFPRLLHSNGWDERSRWVLDLQTGEGALFLPKVNGCPFADLEKHSIWVCPLYSVFLEWFYAHPEHHDDVLTLPSLLELTDEKSMQASAMYGHRRPGPDAAIRMQKAKETETDELHRRTK
jgi:hypothetical protein